MKSSLLCAAVVLVTVLSGLQLLRSSSADEPAAGETATEKSGDAAPVQNNQSADSESADIPRVSVDVARDRAKLLHEVYTSTLDVIHHRYFHADRSMVPARAMEDIFKDMKQSSHVEARWISVNLEPMGVDHKPETDFEKHSARRIKAGDREVEAIDNGYYRRTVAIPLAGGCLNCHDGFFRNSSPTQKFAGLVISIPVQESK
ncbi:MAG: hypothetical protein KDA96_00010 [Planctomycetaceae bacterium]|nr:hypothetical protein [Planctomycetaceae bacterium]